ncbi:MAG: hypothetical protein HY040_16190 [Planctomycetes bacterium]|nr:hypothetical protein [Planctomycetota bacterium]
MIILRYKRGAILLLALAFLAIAQTGRAFQEPAPPPRAVAQKGDIHGDPLPEGALARMGTVRWRHGGPVTFIGYTAQGKQLITACTDGFFRVWAVDSGKETHRFGIAPKEGAVFGAGAGFAVRGGTASTVGLSSDGAKLAAPDPAGVIRVWDVASGKELPTAAGANKDFRRGAGAVGLAFSPDGKTLALRGNDQLIRLIDVGGSKESRTIGKRPEGNQPLRLGGSNALVFLPDGKSLASTFTEVENQKTLNSIRIYDVESGKETRQINLDDLNFSVGGLAVSTDGKTLSWSSQNGATLYDVESGKEIRRLGENPKAFRGLVGAAVFSPNGKLLATRANDNSNIVLWDVESGKQLGRLGESTNPNPRVAIAVGGLTTASQSIAFSPDGRTLVEGTPNNTVRLWDIASRKDADTGHQGHRAAVTQLALSADGKLLTTSAVDGTIRQWDPTSGRESGRVNLPASAGAAALSLDGKAAAVFSAANNSVRLWDVAAAKETATITMGGAQRGVGSGSAVVLSPDGKRLATRGLDQLIRVYDSGGKELAALGKPVRSDMAPAGAFFGTSTQPLAFAPDGDFVAAVTGAGQPIGVGGRMAAPASTSIVLWNVAAKRPRQFDSQSQGVLAMALSQDGRTLAAYNWDRTVALWEVLTGKEYARIRMDIGKAADPGPPGFVRASVLGFTGVVPAIAFAPDCRTIAIGDGPNIYLIDSQTASQSGKLTGHQGAVQSLVFSNDNCTLISGSADTTALVWDISGMIKHERTPIAKWTDEKRAEFWKDLAADPAKARKAMQAFDNQPAEALAAFSDRLKPAVGVEAKHIENLVADLDSDQYPLRRKATEELERLGDLAQIPLETALKKKPTLEMQRRLEKLLDKINNEQPPPADVLQAIRAVQILEKAGTPEALLLVQRISEGAPGHRLTRHAEAMLKRLGL